MNCEEASNIEWNLFMKNFLTILKEDVGVVDEDNLAEELESLFHDQETIQTQLYEYAALALKRAYAAIPMKKGDRNMVKLVIELIPIYKQEATKKLSYFCEMFANPNTDGLDYGRVKITKPLPRRRLTVTDTLRTLAPFLNLCTTLLPHVSVLHEDSLELELMRDYVFLSTKEFRTSKRLLVFITALENDELKLPDVHHDMRNSIVEAMKEFDISLNSADRKFANINSKNENVLLVVKNFNTTCQVEFSTTMRVAILIDSISTRKGFYDYVVTLNPLCMQYGTELEKNVSYIDFGHL